MSIRRRISRHRRLEVRSSNQKSLLLLGLIAHDLAQRIVGWAKLAVGEDSSSNTLLVRNRRTSQGSATRQAALSPFLGGFTRGSDYDLPAPCRTSTTARGAENRFDTVEENSSRHEQIGWNWRLHNRSTCRTGAASASGQNARRPFVIAQSGAPSSTPT